MVRFHAHELLDAVHALLSQVHLGRALGKAGPLVLLDAYLEDMRRHAEALGLASSIRQIDSLVSVLGALGARAEWDEAERGVSQICRRVSEELTSRLVLVGDAKAAELFEAERPFGDLAAITFPNADLDLREAARCYAMARWTAAVFHSMRAVEVVLRELAARHGVESDNPNWGHLLNRIDQVIRGLEEEGADRQRTAEIVLILRQIKHVWRNPVSHAGTHFSEADAEFVWCSTKRLFQITAEHLRG